MKKRVDLLNGLFLRRGLEATKWAEHSSEAVDSEQCLAHIVGLMTTYGLYFQGPCLTRSDLLKGRFFFVSSLCNNLVEMVFVAGCLVRTTFQSPKMLFERAWLQWKDIYFSKRTRLSKEVVPLLQADSGVIGSMIDLGFDGDTKYRSTRSQMEKGTLLKCGVPVANSFPYTL